MKLKMVRKRKFALRPWQRVRKPAGVLKLPSPARKKAKLEDSRERLKRLLKQSFRENDELMRALS